MDACTSQKDFHYITYSTVQHYLFNTIKEDNRGRLHIDWIKFEMILKKDHFCFC